ncbi:hypothetical protein Drorol1_Dr00013743, partial [Drosera rotundifolia]
MAIGFCLWDCLFTGPNIWRRFLIGACFYCVLHVTAYNTDPTEVSVLQSVKRRLIDPVGHLKSWSDGDPCTSNWTGVLCFDTKGTDGKLHVRELLLLHMNLSGTLAPEVGQLAHLQILDFMWNQISGSIPKEIGNISSLVLLLLNGNRLSGFLPEELGKLTNLIRLQVDENDISGPIPLSFANLSSIQHLSLENNSLSGSIPASIWGDKTFSSAARLTVDLRNNLLTNVSGDLAPSVNVTLRLKGNPMCNPNILNVHHYCESDAGGNGTSESSTNSTVACPVQACPTDNYYEYLLAAPEACFCAAPIRVGYRLKSPSFSYFPPYLDDFEVYVTSYLSLDSYDLSIDSYEWEEGPRLRMYLKVFPTISDGNQFNDSEVQRIRDIFTSWQFPGNDLFGPYELLNFTLLGPYQTVVVEHLARGISKGVLAIIIVAVTVGSIMASILAMFLILKSSNKLHIMSKKNL